MKKITATLLVGLLLITLMAGCFGPLKTIRKPSHLFEPTGEQAVEPDETTAALSSDPSALPICAECGQPEHGGHPTEPSVPAASQPCTKKAAEETKLSRPARGPKLTDPPTTTTAPPTTQPPSTTAKVTTARPKTTAAPTTTAAPATAATPAPTTAPTTSRLVGFFNDSYERRVVELVNAERANHGLAPLSLNSSLAQSARVRAKEITSSFGHTRPNGKRFSSAISIGFCGAGENIAAGQMSPESVVNSWMNSDGHRKNILSPDFRLIGVGCYYDEDCQYRFYWSQLFVTP